jgi:hypothetical protein
VWLWIGPLIGVIVIGAIAAFVLYERSLSPEVTSLQFAHNFQDNKAVDVTDTFKSSDPEFFAIVKLNTTNGHPNVKVVWTVVNATDATKRTVTGQTFGEVNKDATSRLLYASVSRGSSTWPVGQYKADVFLDGKLVKTAQFTVTA